ncbi:MAG: hypothetical protein GX913_01005 [Clostridiales bacterium]|nr:hypothetical protein [Clostridiales bacterium]
MIIKQNKYKAVVVLIYFVICIAFLSSCGNEKQSETQHENTVTTSGELIERDTTVNESQIKETNEQEQEITESEETLLPGTYPKEFTFSSGAGGWGTSIILNPNGSFEGIYHDSEMGDRGDDYPHGSVDICLFSGSFDDIKQINDYTYSMTLSEVITRNTEGEVWIEEKVRYIASAPYGLESGKEFILYTPKTPVKELYEDFWSWWPNRYLPEEEALETLSCYGIYNKELGYGFFTYE